jgi:ubiquitin-protein ligase
MSIKRINNELKRIENYLLMNNLNISFENDSDRRVVSIFDNDKLIMDIHLPNEYPFKPYNINLIKHYKYTRHFQDNRCIHIHDTINYNKWLSNIKIINNKYHKLFMSNLLGNNFTISNNSCCFCCSSITCSSNWNPALTIEKGIIEYKKFLIYKLYSSPLMINYLEKLYNNLFPKLSNDLKEHIFTLV